MIPKYLQSEHQSLLWFMEQFHLMPGIPFNARPWIPGWELNVSRVLYKSTEPRNWKCHNFSSIKIIPKATPSPWWPGGIQNSREFQKIPENSRDTHLSQLRAGWLSLHQWHPELLQDWTQIFLYSPGDGRVGVRKVQVGIGDVQVGIKILKRESKLFRWESGMVK